MIAERAEHPFQTVDERSRVTIARRERWLLVAAVIFVVLNHVALLLARARSPVRLWMLFAWVLCSAGGHLALGRLLPRRDPLIWPVVMLLTGWGLALIGRLAPGFAPRQAIWMIFSTVVLLGIAMLPPRLRLLQRYRYTWLLAGLVLLGATLILGVNPSGDLYAPRLWLGFWGIYFQPSEILKLLLVVFLASYLADKREIITQSSLTIGGLTLPPLPYVAPMLLMWGFCMILLIWQRDLGAASLFFIVFLAMLYVSTGQPGYVIAGLALLGVAGFVGYRLFSVVRLRVDTWWNPWPEASDRAFQIVQSLLAFAAGGVLGEGIGQGAPTYIPVVHSDFVFAAIAEEWGLLGALGVVICLTVLTMRILRIAINRQAHPFISLLSAGIGTLLAVQSLLIMAGVLKMIPLTGVTLPFVSYGGSSLLSSFVMIGLALRASDPARYPLQRRPGAPSILDFEP